MTRNILPFGIPRLFALLAAYTLSIAAVSTALSPGAFAQGQVKEVVRLDPVQPTSNDGTIEVLEFFGYGCIHCANLEPALETWAKRQPADVRLKRVPAGFGSSGVDDIPIFYTLEAMGQVDRLHKKLFEAIFNDRVMIAHKPTMLKWLEKQGVDPAQYESVERSFSVQSKIMRGKGLAGQYKITATPMMVVNGRYIVQQVGGTSIFDTLDRLIAEQRALMKPATGNAPKAAPARTAPAKASTAPAPGK